MKKLLFIYNPKSGKRLIESRIDEIMNIFSSAGYEVDVFKTATSGDAGRKAYEAAACYDLIVCGGGDGTLSDIISGIMRHPFDERPVVGLIPAGSTNDIKSNYGIPKDILKAAYVSVNGTPYITDIGGMNDGYFSYVASIGELSAVSCFTPQKLKNVLGYLAYLIVGLKELIKMKSNDIIVSYDGKTVSGNYFLGMVTNASTVGGFSGVTGPNVDLQDGLHEVVLVKKPANLIEFFKEVKSLVFSKGKDAEKVKDLVIRFKARDITFTSEDEVQWVIDGENAGKHKEVHIVNYNKAVRIMTPALTNHKNIG